MIESQENYYWLFSAAAQSIAAFVAFLLTGYAFVHSVMENLQRSDESLFQVHESLKKDYHRRLQVLSGVTALAIVMSLTCVYLNPIVLEYKQEFFLATAFIDFSAIVGGILFVVSIVDPDRYQMRARKLLEEEEKVLAPSGKKVGVGDFLAAFVALEKSLNNYIRDHSINEAVSMTSYRPLSFSDMIRMLTREQIIDDSFANGLRELSKYRNLVAHGHVSDVTQAMVERVESTRGKWMAIINAV